MRLGQLLSIGRAVHEPLAPRAVLVAGQRWCGMTVGDNLCVEVVHESALNESKIGEQSTKPLRGYLADVIARKLIQRTHV